MSPLVRKRISNLQVGLCGHPACRIGAATCVQRDRNLELIVKSIDYGLMECLEGIRTPCKLLKRWSGRPDSNRRRPAWEAGILPLNYSRSMIRSKYGRIIGSQTSANLARPIM